MRAFIAFAVYLVLCPAWRIAGAHGAYENIVVKIASAVVRATQHFPTYSTIEGVKLTYLDFPVILTVSYFIVSTRTSLGRRLRRFGALLLLILVLDVTAIILEAKLDAAQRVQGLLLPWEFRMIDGFEYLFVTFGLNIAAFVVMLLGFVWNSEISQSSWSEQSDTARNSGKKSLTKHPRGGSAVWLRTPCGATVAVLLVFCVGFVTWGHLRESDPRHIRTHVRLGHLFLRSGQSVKAEEQYAIALEHGSTDGQAWLNLAHIYAQNGRTGEAIRLLRRGLEVVEDVGWRQQIQNAKERLISGR